MLALLSVPKLKAALVIIPILINACTIEPVKPETLTGDISRTYTGTSVLFMPTTMPITKRQMAIIYMFGAICTRLATIATKSA
jgi:hypothetical protein